MLGGYIVQLSGIRGIHMSQWPNVGTSGYMRTPTNVVKVHSLNTVHTKGGSLYCAPSIREPHDIGHLLSQVLDPLQYPVSSRTMSQQRASAVHHPITISYKTETAAFGLVP